ncbi:uncharacterized protein PADG_03444 [Paracoccidioides brasiliensis Pb18]|uniref:Urease accessory protein UreD n=1 Tax=Paracoccidioides brasiliensis (strain Pb18) TaxID=502780 RepID=C1G574_PARBD|nr:uncharacterized protein PADG_03444 [Paracoccidioides brasiliensis Pb18]EEH47346.2 hypothetical protein PADG_03444 [Paracoccidioides brasiliensis Pb18]
MPHKHKRRQRDDEYETLNRTNLGNNLHSNQCLLIYSDNFDLPPTKIAKPLPAFISNGDSKETSNKRRQSKKSVQNPFIDDTPKAFMRMMQQFQKATSSSAPRTPSWQEDGGTKSNRQRKRGGEREVGALIANTTTSSQSQPASSSYSIPKILPGERMSDFAARVDQALPLSGISKKSGTSSISKDPALKNLREQRQTKHERRLLRLQREWRAEEARIREREEAEREEREAEQDEVNEQWKAWEEEAGLTKKKKKAAAKTRKNKKNNTRKGKAGLLDGNASDRDTEGNDNEGDDDNDDDDDPWAKLNRKAKAMQPVNPFEVVQAPPAQLTKPKEKFKMRGVGGAVVNVANVPAAAGSLRAREELAEHRQSIVDEYRKMIATKRG